MKKLLLLIALICSQSNIMEVYAQIGATPRAAKNKKVATTVSATKKVTTVKIASQLDSLSYTMGMAQTQGLKNYLVGKMNIDTTYINDFMKGVKSGAGVMTKQDQAYNAGIQIGQQIASQMMKGMNQQLFGQDTTKTINKEIFLAGFEAGVLGKKDVMTMEVAEKYAQTAVEKMKSESMDKQYGANKAEGIKFLAENKLKEGVITTASGLQYKIITKGTGEIPTSDSKVKVHYKGNTLDGKEFDSSYKRNEPLTINAGQVIKGWTEALTMMPVGSKWELYIPQELAYGSREAGPIKPFSTLVFEVELLSVEK